MTSLSREVGRSISIAEATPHVVKAWREVFAPVVGASTTVDSVPETLPTRA